MIFRKSIFIHCTNILIYFNILRSYQINAICFYFQHMFIYTCLKLLMLILLNFGLNQDVAKNFEICDCCKFPYVYTDALTHKQIQEGNEIIHWYKRQLVRDIKNFDCKSHIHYSPYELAFPSLTPTTTLPITITRNKIFQDTKKVKKCTKCCFPELILFKTILAVFYKSIIFVTTSRHIRTFLYRKYLYLA